jgi:hypothetical protein
MMNASFFDVPDRIDFIAQTAAKSRAAWRALSPSEKAA